MKIGIIVATEQEINATKELLKDIKITNIFDLQFFEGTAEGDDVVLVKCGIGKVNAGRVTQILIDKFDVKSVINVGAAGAINPELNIKDIVIGSELVQYDYDTSALGSTKKGEIDGVGMFMKSDKNLIDKCLVALSKMTDKDFKYKVGRIATADLFCSDKKLAEDIRKNYNAECVEMEGGAVAQVCKLDKIPFVVIRGISDSPNGNNGIDYMQYCSIAAKQAAEMLDKILIEI